MERKPPIFTIRGVKIWDPRTQKLDYSSNPALVMADLIKRKIIFTSWEPSDEILTKLADICDVEVKK